FILVLAARSSAAPVADNRAPGTIRMAEGLEHIVKTVAQLTERFQSAEQAQALRRTFAEHPDLARDPVMRFRLAGALLNSGRNLEGLAEFDALERLSAEQGTPVSGANKLTLRLDQALCYLREAERLNCLSNHNADSCLFPLRGGGIDLWQGRCGRGIGVLDNPLAKFRDNLA